MPGPKDIIIVTTPDVQPFAIKRYFKPVTAHLVAGTNVFNDFFAGLTDVLGGRSNTYQKAISDLYAEAINNLKESAYSLGANAVVGLSVDMDEISGKGKSMFMLTAIGTAVILEKEVLERKVFNQEKLQNVPVESMRSLAAKQQVEAGAKEGTLQLNAETWDFINQNNIPSILPFLLINFQQVIKNSSLTVIDEYQRRLVTYIESLGDSVRNKAVYESLTHESYFPAFLKLAEAVKELNLVDFPLIDALLDNPNFDISKRGVKLLKYDKAFFDKSDIEVLSMFQDKLRSIFPERGNRKFKRKLLSSTEKEIWSCECGKVNDIGKHCNGCKKDIMGFSQNEEKPDDIIVLIEKKKLLLQELLA